MRLRKKHPSHAYGKHKSAAEETKIYNELKQVYGIGNNSSMPDMSRLETISQPVFRRVLISILFVLIALAAGLSGAVLLNRPFSANPDDMLSLDIALPDEIKSGAPLDIVVSYENPTRVPIANAEISIELPKSFIKISGSPESANDSPYSWKIGALPPNKKGEIVLNGIFIATPGEPITAQAFARFQPSNFSAWFEDIASASSPIVSSNLEIVLEGPARAATEEPVKYIAKIKNKGQENN
ncbi:MAG: hypothetical protein AAB851_03600 [Patescibacteria group bacterium]